MGRYGGNPFLTHEKSDYVSSDVHGVIMAFNKASVISFLDQMAALSITAGKWRVLEGLH